MFPLLAQIKLKICNQSNTNMGACYIVMGTCTQEHTHTFKFTNFQKLSQQEK